MFLDLTDILMREDFVANEIIGIDSLIINCLSLFKTLDEFHAKLVGIIL